MLYGLEIQFSERKNPRQCAPKASKSVVIFTRNDHWIWLTRFSKRQPRPNDAQVEHGNESCRDELVIHVGHLGELLGLATVFYEIDRIVNT